MIRTILDSPRWQTLLKSLKRREVITPLAAAVRGTPHRIEILEARIAPAAVLDLLAGENVDVSGDGADDLLTVFSVGGGTHVGFINSDGLSSPDVDGVNVIQINGTEIHVLHTAMDAGTLSMSGGGGTDQLTLNAGLPVFNGLTADFENIDPVPGLTIGGGGLTLNATTSDITITGNIAKTSGGDATADIRSVGSVIINSGAGIASSSGKLSVILNADRDASGQGGVFINSGGTTIDTLGGDFTIGGGATPASTAVFGPTDKGIYIDGATISTGAGNISIRGQGDSTSGGGASIGIDLTGASITTTSGNITLVGTGGAVSDGFTMGVSVFNGSSINTATGAIAITGTTTATGSDAYGVKVQSNSKVEATGNGTIAITGTGSATGSGTANDGIALFDNADVLSQGNGAISLTGTTGANSVAISTGSGANDITIGGASAAGALTISADTITISNAALQSTGALVLQPTTATTTIGIGNSATGAFNLDAAEIGALADGFSSLTIGKSDGNANVDVRAITFTDPATIRVPSGGTITVNGQITGSGNASISLDGAGATTVLLANIVTAGNAITISDSVQLQADVLLDTTNAGGSPAGAAITIAGATDADLVGNNRTLTLTAGTGGAVTQTANIGATTALGTYTITSAASANLGLITASAGGVSVTASAITLGGNITTTGTGTAGAVTITGPATLGGPLTINTDASTTDAAISFSSTIDGAQTLTLTSGFANATISGATGGTTPLTGLTVTAGDFNASAIGLASASALSVTNTGTASAITGSISGTNATLTKAGTGTLTLSGTAANTHTGVTTINDGTLLLSKTAGINAIAGNITIGDASGSDILQLGASNQIADTSVLTFTAGGSGNSAFFRLNGFSETVQGIQTSAAQAAVIENNSGSTASTLTIDTGASSYTYDGIVRNGSTATLAIAKLGTGTLTLADTAAVAAVNYSGATTIGAGKLVLENLAAFSSAITVSSSTAGALTINQTTNSLSLGTVISGSGTGGLTKTGTGALTLTVANTFSGGTTVNGGTLALALGGATGTIRGTLTINTGATVNLTAVDAMGYNSGVSVATVNVVGGTINNSVSGNQAFITNFVLTGGAITSTGGGGFHFNTGFGITTLASSTTSLISAGLVNRGGALTFTTAQGTTPSGFDLTVSGAISTNGGTGVAKAGAGTLQLSGTNTYTGTTTVSAGTLTFSGSLAAGGTITVGNTAATKATLNIVAGASVTALNLSVGTNATATGAVYQSGGTLTLTQAANTANFQLGAVAGGYGYYSLSGGTLSMNEMGIGAAFNGSTGVMEVSGGTLNNAGWLTVGRGGTTSSGVLNVNGGAVVLAGTVGGSKISMQWGGSSGAQSVINISNGGSITGPANTTYVLDLAATNTTGASGIVNLGTGGTLAIGGITASQANPTALVNFNGGTLKSTVTNASFMTSANIDSVYVQSGGGTINNNGFTDTISRALLAPTGNGVTTPAIASGGSGYIGVPLVTVVRGAGDTTGVGATAMATINPATGLITGITITNPGVGYTATPTFTLTGGGGTGASLTGAAPAANTSGGLTFAGTGAITLSGASTYSGGTSLGAGILRVSTSDSALGTGALTFTGNATLATASGGGARNLGNAIALNSGVTGAFDGGFANLTLSGLVSGPGNFAQVFAGTVVLANASNSFSGTVTTSTSGGILSVSSDGNFGAVPGSATPGKIVMNGGTIAVTSGFTLDSNRGIAVGPTSGSGTGTFDVAGGQTLTYGGILANNGGTGALTKTSAGTLTLSGTNTYTGVTTINAGTVSISADNNLGTAPGSAATNITFGGGTLAVTTGFTLGATRSISVGAGGGFLSVAGAENLAYAGAISGTGALSKMGTGTLTYTGTASLPSFLPRFGTTIVDTGGSITSTSYTSIGVFSGDNATLTVKGTGQYLSNGDFNVSDLSGSTGVLNIEDSALVRGLTLYVGKNGSASGTVNQSGGTFQKSTGTAGEWRIGGPFNAVTDAASVGIYNLSGGTFDSGAASVQIGAFATGTFTQTGGIATVGGFLAMGRFAGGNGTLSISAGSFTANTVALTLVGEAGTGTLNVSGTGTLNASALSIGHAAGGVGTVNLNGGTIAANIVQKIAGTTATFNFNGGTLKAAASSATFLQGLTTANVRDGGALIDSNGNSITVAQTLVHSAIGGDAATDGGLTKTGAGTLTLSGANTYTGDTAISAGTLALGAAGVLPDGAGKGNVSVAGTLDLAGFSETLNGLSGSGTIDNSVAGTPTLTVGANDQTSAFAGIIANTAGTVALTKTGAGTLSLSGANTFTGATTIGVGTLALVSTTSNNNVASSPTIDTATGATLDVTGLDNGAVTATLTLASGQTLKGAGTVSGILIAASVATVAPGASPGILNTGDVTLASGSTLSVEINGTIVGTDYDQTNVTGAVAIANATLSISLGFTPTIGNTFTIISNDAADSVTGVFGSVLDSGYAPVGGLIDNSYFPSNGRVWRIDYDGGDGNDVVLTDAGDFTTSGALSGGTLTISDIVGANSDDALTLTLNGANVRIADPANRISAGAGATQIDANTIEVPLASITGSVVFDTLGGDDTLTVDFSGGNAIPSGGITFTGGSQTTEDKLIVTGGSATTVTHTFLNANDGSVNIDGSTISYTGLEPVTDNMSAVNRVFDFTGGAETITLTDTGGADGMTTIDSTLGESVTFTNPSTSLTISAGTGDDTITISSIDAAYAGSLTIAGGGDNDALTLASGLPSLSALTTTSATLAALPALTIGAGGVSITTTAGAITLSGLITSGDNVTLTAATTINDSAADNVADIVANTVTLSAQTGIGTTSSFDLDVNTVTSATSVTGGLAIDLLDSDNSGVTVASANASTSGSVVFTGTTGTATRTFSAVNATSGDITITANDGNLDIADNQTASGTIAITSNATGDIIRSGAGATLIAPTVTLIANGADGDIGTLAAPILTDATTIAFTGTGTGEVAIIEANGASFSGSTGSGNIDLRSTTGNLAIGGNITTTGDVQLFASAGSITRSAGTISADDLFLDAPAGQIGASGAAIQTDAATITSNSTGDQFITETNALSAIALDASSAAITLTTGGALSDTDASTDVIAGTATLNITGQIGALINRIATGVDTLNTNSSGNDQFLDEDNGLNELNLVAGAGTVDLTVAAGSVTTSDATADITANAAVISMIGIGQSLNIDTAVNALTANTGDSQTIDESNGLTALDLNTPASVTLTLAAGSITDTDAAADVSADDFTVTAPGGIGSGANRIRTSVTTLTSTTTNASQFWLEDGGLSALNASAGTGTFDLQMTAGALSDTDAGTDISATAAAIQLLAAGGFIGTSANAIHTSIATLQTQTNNGDQFFEESNGITAIDLAAGTGDITLALLAGTITDTDGANDVTAGAFTTTAPGGIGAALNPVATTAGSVAFTAAGAANVFITESDGANVNGTTGSGTITLVTTTGDWTIDGDISTTGNVTTTASAGDILRSAGTVSGNVLTLTAGGDIGASGAEVQTSGTTIAFTGAGDVFLTESNGASVSGTTGSGQIELTSTTGNWTVIGTGTSTTGDVTLAASAGDLIRSGAGAIVSGDTVTLTAGGADGDIGSSGTRFLTTAASVVFAGSGTGDVYVTETDGANVQGSTGSGLIDLIATTGNWAIDGNVSTTGNVNVTASAGDLLRSAAIATVSGNTVTLTTVGADGDIGSSVVPILTAATTISFAGTGSGDVFITESDNAAISGSTTTGDITLASSSGSLTVGLVSTSAAAGTVSIDADDAILDGNGGSNNIVALGALLIGGSGVGTAGDKLDTTIANLEADGGLGGVFISDGGALNIGGVSAFNGVETALGDIMLTSGGALTISEDIAATAGDVTLTATAGSITETGGAIDGGVLTTISVGGTLLNDAANQVDAFNATNTTSGNVELVNTASPLDIETIINPTGGSVSVDNGGDIGVSGAVTSGSPANGGDITLISSGVLTVNANVNSNAGTGGTLTLSSSVIVNASPTVGFGDIILQGGAGSLLINAPITLAVPLTLTATDNVIINAGVTVTGLGNDLTVIADSDLDTAGGVLVALPGQLNAGRDLTVRGSDFVNASYGFGPFPGSSILIEGDGLNAQLRATRSVLVENSAAAGTAAIGLGGRVESTNSNLSVGNMVFDGAVELIDDDASAIIGGVGSVTFTSTINSAGGNDLTVRTDLGNVNFLGVVGGVDAPGDIAIPQAGNVHLFAEFTTDTFTVTNAALTVTYDGPVTINGIGDAHSVHATSLVTNAAVTSAAGNILWEVDNIELNDTVAGPETLTIRPIDATRSIGINGTGLLNLDTAEIAQLQDGFTQITIGRTNGSGTVTTDGATFLDPATILAPATGGIINVDGTLDGQSDASFTLQAPTINLNVATPDAALQTEARLVHLIGNVKLLANTLIDTNFAAAGGGVTVDGTINGAFDLTIDAGLFAAGGAVNLNGGSNAPGGASVGGGTALASIDISGSALTLHPQIITSGAQSYHAIAEIITFGGALRSKVSGAITLDGPVTLNGKLPIITSGIAGADIVFTGAVNSEPGEPGALAMNAGTSGNVTFGDDVGASVPLANFEITKSANATFAGDLAVVDFIKIDATEIDFNGGPNSVSGETLTLQTDDPAQAVYVGGVLDSGAAVLDITQGELDALADGFTSVTIARAAGTAGIIIDAAGIDISDPFIFRQSTRTGTIDVNGPIDATGDGAVTMVSSTTTFHAGADITTAGGTIDIDYAYLDSDIVFTTTDGDIVFRGSLHDTGAGGHEVTLNAGAGDITFTRAVGTVGPVPGLITANSTGTTKILGGLNAEGLVTDAGGVTQLKGSEIRTTTDAGQIYGDDIVLLSSIRLRADLDGSIAMAGTVNALLGKTLSFSLLTNTGDITIGGNVGGALGFGTMSTVRATTAGGDAVFGGDIVAKAVSLRAANFSVNDVTTTSSQTYTGLATATFNGALSSGKDLRVTSQADIVNTAPWTVFGKTNLKTRPDADITITGAGNAFGTLQLAGDNATIVEDSATSFVSVKLAGDLNVTSGGDITQTGRLTASQLDATSGGTIAFTGGVQKLQFLGNISAQTGITILSGYQNLVISGDITNVNGDVLISANSRATNFNVLNLSGADAIQITGAGRFLIYSYSATLSNLGGLVTDFAEFDKRYPEAPLPANTGNGVIYVVS